MLNRTAPGSDWSANDLRMVVRKIYIGLMIVKSRKNLRFNFVEVTFQIHSLGMKQTKTRKNKINIKNIVTF